ncbi:TetR/AcrR family transcriptional regulator [Mangrovicoccus algicola]|uniref:TetR/AcrR family transcriptional regulator n=1 Tax=Mangrovicoccus algicola TaxID=2771008 RepID=A0A8J7CZT2_9RHOB|nr:TetR/AcrR family transcriptional regulator [Mangrovicoccus algicola]MBE3638398.1 TetR/AcrR family transcriptional regulator [Mangrovicoccus algicola]
MSDDTAKPRRKPRADSLRNRETLLAAAREVFSEGGPEASLEAVARTAGLGIGTLYRHFPTREALFQAVYLRETDQMVALAESLTELEPEAALRAWMRGFIGMVATKKGMLAALAPALDKDCPTFAEAADRMRAAAARLLERGRQEGVMRDDIAPEEMMRVVVGICYTRDGEGWRETVTRMLDIFIDGLCCTPDAAAAPRAARR